MLTYVGIFFILTQAKTGRVMMGKARRKEVVQLSNFRELLAKLIDVQFTSRNTFCDVMRLDRGQLSRVLAGTSSFSVEALERIFSSLGYSVVVVPKKGP